MRYEEILSETPDIAINSMSMEDLILPIKGDRDTLKRPQQLRSLLFDDISEEIDQLNEIPIYLKVQGIVVRSLFKLKKL